MEREYRAVDWAAAYAVAAHAGQVDKQGEDYILHVARVAEAVHGEDRIVAWLHDVAEDTAATTETVASAMRQWRCSEDAIEAMRLLTKPKGERYEDYIRRIAEAEGRAGEIARAVKLADVLDNARRLPMRSEEEWVTRTTRKYTLALRILEDER